MKKTFKYKLKLSPIQLKELNDIFWFCRFLYNNALEERILVFKTTKESRTYKEQSKFLPEIKKIFACETSKIHSQTLQFTLKQVDSAYKNFFERNKSDKVGFPRFKGKDRFRSICFPQVFDDLSKMRGIQKLPNDNLKVSGLTGEVKVIWHRPIEGRCKQARIVRKVDQYYLCLSCDNVPNNILSKTGKEVAIDFGITNFITMDDGSKIHHPKPYNTAKEKLAYRQRILSAKQKESNNYNKQRKLVRKTYEKITNIRDDFSHKTANYLIKNYDRIIIEYLNIKNMLEKGDNYSVKKRNISDVAIGKFVEFLTYKAESADKLIVKVNPKNTSKMCSCCGKLNKNLTLADRVYKCEFCKLAIDRDHNSAINIKRLGTSLAITK